MRTVSSSGDYFLVVGLRQELGTDDQGYGSVSLEILSMFDSLENALIYRDIHSEMDTTTHTLTILSTQSRSEVPEIEVFLHVIIEDDGVIRVRSRCVEFGTEPWLREEPGLFEALCYPEDKDLIIERAQDHMAPGGRRLEVAEEVPPAVESMI